MKILHILDHSLPLHSGYTFRSQNIFLAQRSRGWEPVILTSPKHEESWKGEWHWQEDIGDFTYYRSGAVASAPIPFAYESKLMLRLAKRIRQVADMEKPDILHAHSPVLNAIPALWVGRQMKIPVVYEIRAFWEDAAVDHGTYAENSWKYRLTRAIETWVCKKADHVAILCHGLKNDLIKRGIEAKKITPVFNAVNPENFALCDPDEQFVQEWGLKNKKVIGFIGSFYRYEGLDLLVEAFSQIADLHPDAVLLLIGGGEMAKELKEKANLLNIGDKLIMPGRIDHEKIAGVYALIDILAYPRYSMRLTELVTPLKPLEAMAMGKAFIASDVGGHKELIRHNHTGFLFPAGNAKALAAGLDRLLRDETLRTGLQTEGFRWVREHHTWEKTTSVYVPVYKNILDGKFLQ
ncbi:MAG: TIGR04063 family PEP-CTERM/XrtA system glycosyltransferase [Desulfococcaceae bacterium]